MLDVAEHPNYYLYANLLSEGWIMNRKVDNSDMQYASFRNRLPTLFVLAAVYIFFSRLYRAITVSTTYLKQTYFYFLTSVIIITVLHGSSSIKILVIVSISYLIGRVGGGTQWNPVMTWTFNLAILFLNEYYKGYKFESIGFPELVSLLWCLSFVLTNW